MTKISLQRRKPVRIRNVDIGNGLTLAPMAGVTDRTFRMLCRRQGADYVVSEMISAKAIAYGDRKTPELARLGGDEHPAALQIFGSDPSIMAEAAAWLCDNYAPDVIDINMGCPVRKIFTSGDGSALMRRPELAGRIVSAVRGAVSVPVTVKLRTGIDSGHINAPELARLLEASGADGLCIHGRTREQMYAPPVDLDTIAAVKSAVGIPVIGNGGIHCAADAARMMERTGVDSVAIGQGACGNPWLFAEIKAAISGKPYTAPAVSERIAAAKEHMHLLMEDKGEYIGLREARKHLGWYITGIRGAAAMRDRINREEREDAICALLDELAEHAEEYAHSGYAE